ncbi:XrtA-associated tyrosine autokinase [Aquisalimonas asiatica]|uniref:non-specific protein-tyrosine kinase n=1 Tax=Aquisalimonas asiatica TaxID=406100 RepID=A0A1H8U4W7_9GAMM|nr:XrtA-associated tyrosine autokinase [Aquisalimonas asiatica]SEO97688.1 AAA domain-containing protein [Aquisalimonas asiatica]
MSIIEKAISKQRKAREDDGERIASVNADSAGEAGPSRVEQAMARVRPDAGQPDAESGAAAGNGAAPAEAGVAGQRATTTQRYAEISRARLAELGLIDPAGGRSQLAEEFRLVKRPILAGAFATGEDAIHHGNLVMVTSALPREGKSFSTINLAMSIAMEFDRTVLLVDADVARPSILGYLGVESEGSGLLDLLADDSIDFSDALIRTDIDNLTLMPAGKTYPRANEMLASRDMEQLVAEMSARYPDRIILFDTPPLLATSEASVLAQHMGQIVFVVEAEHTPQDATVRAIEQLEGCEVVLPLLNKTKPLPGMRYTHGYYGSYYGT